jgi:hypothetical protein
MWKPSRSSHEKFQDLAVKLAATKALCNALEFANKNFEVEAERNYIMQVICEACTCANDEIKEHAYQCLNKIAERCCPPPSSIMTLAIPDHLPSIPESQPKATT